MSTSSRSSSPTPSEFELRNAGILQRLIRESDFRRLTRPQAASCPELGRQDEDDYLLQDTSEASSLIEHYEKPDDAEVLEEEVSSRDQSSGLPASLQEERGFEASTPSSLLSNLQETPQPRRVASNDQLPTKYNEWQNGLTQISAASSQMKANIGYRGGLVVTPAFLPIKFEVTYDLLKCKTEIIQGLMKELHCDRKTCDKVIIVHEEALKKARRLMIGAGTMKPSQAASPSCPQEEPPISSKLFKLNAAAPSFTPQSSLVSTRVSPLESEKLYHIPFDKAVLQPRPSAPFEQNNSEQVLSLSPYFSGLTVAPSTPNSGYRIKQQAFLRASSNSSPTTGSRRSLDLLEMDQGAQNVPSVSPAVSGMKVQTQKNRADGPAQLWPIEARSDFGVLLAENPKTCLNADVLTSDEKNISYADALKRSRRFSPITSSKSYQRPTPADPTIRESVVTQLLPAALEDPPSQAARVDGGMYAASPKSVSKADLPVVDLSSWSDDIDRQPNCNGTKVKGKVTCLNTISWASVAKNVSGTAKTIDVTPKPRVSREIKTRPGLHQSEVTERSMPRKKIETDFPKQSASSGRASTSKKSMRSSANESATPQHSIIAALNRTTEKPAEVRKHSSVTDQPHALSGCSRRSPVEHTPADKAYSEIALMHNMPLMTSVRTEGSSFENMPASECIAEFSAISSASHLTCSNRQESWANIASTQHTIKGQLLKSAQVRRSISCAVGSLRKAKPEDATVIKIRRDQVDKDSDEIRNLLRQLPQELRNVCPESLMNPKGCSYAPGVCKLEFVCGLYAFGKPCWYSYVDTCKFLHIRLVPKPQLSRQAKKKGAWDKVHGKSRTKANAETQRQGESCSHEGIRVFMQRLRAAHARGWATRYSRI